MKLFSMRVPLHSFAAAAVLSCGMSAHGEVTLSGTTTLQGQGELVQNVPNPRPIGGCSNRSKQYNTAALRAKISNALFARIGQSLSDSTPFPEILIIEECKDTWIISTVLGSTTFGSVLRVFIAAPHFKETVNTSSNFRWYSVLIQ